MKHSEQINEVAAAIAQAQTVIENASKSSTNPHFKNRYADLAEVLNTVRPVFSAAGLAIIQAPSFADGIVSVVTTIAHKSGQWVSCETSAPVSKQDAQGVGSAITYCRRYGLAAMAGIAQEDDDAQAAVGQADAKKPKPANLTIGDAEFKWLTDAMDSAGVDKVAFCEYFGIPQLAALPMSQYAKACAMIEAKRKQKESENV